MAEGVDGGAIEGGSPGVGADTSLISTPAPDTTGAENGSLLDWRGGFDPEIRSNPTLAKYANANEAAKALIHLSQLQGRSIQIPQGEASPEEWARVWEKLGRPKAPGDYQVKPPDLPEGVTWDTEMQAQFLETAHALGLNQSQAQALMDFEGRRVTQAMKLMEGRQAQAQVDAKRALAQEFGAAAPRKLEEARLLFTQLVAGRFGGEYGMRAAEKLNNSELGSDPDVVASFSALFSMLDEGQFVESAWGGVQTSPDVLESRKNELLARQFDAKTSPADKQTIQSELQGIYRQLAVVREAQERRTAGAGRR